MDYLDAQSIELHDISFSHAINALEEALDYKKPICSSVITNQINQKLAAAMMKNFSSSTPLSDWTYKYTTCCGKTANVLESHFNSPWEPSDS